MLKWNKVGDGAVFMKQRCDFGLNSFINESIPAYSNTIYFLERQTSKLIIMRRCDFILTMWWVSAIGGI